MKLWQKIRRAYARGGIVELCRVAYYRARNGRWRVDPHAVSPFDARWGTETEAVADQLELDTPTKQPNWAYAARYQATEAGTLESVIAHTRIAPADWTFVDLGSGKGRVVMEAALLGFRHAIGVEFSESLHQIACRNRAAFLEHGGPGTVEFHHLDAADFTFPDGPLVIYLYNPFMRPVMERVVTHACQRPGPTWVWFHGARHLLGADEALRCWDENGFQPRGKVEHARCLLWFRE